MIKDFMILPTITFIRNFRTIRKIIRNLYATKKLKDAYKFLIIFIVEKFLIVWNCWNEHEILDIQKYNIVRHWFFQKIGFLRFFLRKFLLTVLHIFHRKYTPNFQKIDFSIYPNILYIYDQNFMLVPTIKLLEFSDKNWETYMRLLIFWSIFWLFFLLSKVSKMKFYQKSLIYKNTTLYDIDFPQKIGFLRFFLRKFLLTVLHIFHRKYTPNFQKIDFSIYPNILYIYDQNFMLVPTIKLLEFSDKNWETYMVF